MKLLAYVGIGVVALWLQVTLAPYVSVGGIKPNLPLVTVLVLGLRWMDPWLFVYGAITGLAVDVFSHGVLGVYASSFFAVSFLARVAGNALYENNPLFTALLTAGLTLVEGGIAVSLFKLHDPGVSWWAWMLADVLPQAVYHAVLAVPVWWVIGRLERRLKLQGRSGI